MTSYRAVGDRDPSYSLAGCHRIVVVGRTGSGKTTLARELAAALDRPHVELDALYFMDDLSTVAPDVLRERTRQAIGGSHWVTDGNKSAVRDLVWPRADTLVWLDYPLVVSIWRLAGRARSRTTRIRRAAAQGSTSKPVPHQIALAARGVVTALRSHAGQRKEFPKLFMAPENRHLAVTRLRSPRATRLWFARVTRTDTAQ